MINEGGFWTPSSGASTVRLMLGLGEGVSVGVLVPVIDKRAMIESPGVGVQLDVGDGVDVRVFVGSYTPCPRAKIPSADVDGVAEYAFSESSVSSESSCSS